MEQRNLLVVTVFQLVQRLTNRIDIAVAQHLTDKLQLAAATLFFDSLGEFDGVAQVSIQRNFIQRVFPQVNEFRAKTLQFFRVALNFTLTDPDDFIIFIFNVITGHVVEPVFGLLCHLRLLKKRG